MGLVGALGPAPHPHLDARGLLTLDHLSLGWLVGADNRWYAPADEPAVRQHRLGAAPVYETAQRVPGGDARQRVYGVSGPPGLVVVEIENAAPAPIAVAFVLAVAANGSKRVHEIDLDASCRLVADGAALHLPRSPQRWATAAGGSTREQICSGAACDGAFEKVAGRAVEATVVFPIPHHTRLRVALTTGGEHDAVDLNALPDATTAARGWERQLERGMRTELPEETQTRVDHARADLLLAPDSAAAFAALEQWGFDEEAAAMWQRLSFSARRAAKKYTPPAGDVLHDVRAMLVREARDRVEVLPGFPAEWRGANLAVHDAPLRRGGALSYALRWHRERPALLWDAPEGVELRAPALSPDWHAPGGAGEGML